MASTPQYKVYDPSKRYVAACKHVEDAAALIALYGDGATIRHDHRIVLWTEGQEAQPAGESYDYVAEVVTGREEAIWLRIRNRMRGNQEPVDVDGVVNVPGGGQIIC